MSAAAVAGEPPACATHYQWSTAVQKIGAPGEIRTHDLCLRRAMVEIAPSSQAPPEPRLSFDLRLLFRHHPPLIPTRLVATWLLDGSFIGGDFLCHRNRGVLL